MKKSINLDGKIVTFYGINLCSYNDKGDYELFASEELNLDMEKIQRSITGFRDIKTSIEVLQFTLKTGTRITLYSEGRMILEGLCPDTHEAAFALLESILEN